MRKVEAVRPTCGNILDLWEDMMRPFEEDEAKGGNRDIGDERDKGDNLDRRSAVGEDKERDEAISVEEEEGAKVRIGITERAPSKEEVAMHMVNHIPFRSWCSHCVKGKAHGNQHRRRKVREQEDREPIVSVDYMFMHDNQGESEEKGMPIMVIKDRKTRIIRAWVVPQKGNHAYGIKVLSGVVESLGHSRVILKSDRNRQSCH